MVLTVVAQAGGAARAGRVRSARRAGRGTCTLPRLGPQVLDHAGEHAIHLGQRRLGIVGAGDVERGLVERADEDVGERADGLGDQGARVDARLARRP